MRSVLITGIAAAVFVHRWAKKRQLALASCSGLSGLYVADSGLGHLLDVSCWLGRALLVWEIAVTDRF